MGVICALFLLAPVARGATSASATVLVIAANGSGRSFGSGSFVSADGIVLTCYHVVQGATSISIVTDRQLISDEKITVEGINPDEDLAILRVRDPQLSINYFSLNNGSPLPTDPLWVIGYVGGLANQSINVRTTQAGFALSRGFLGPNGNSIFANTDVDLIPINTLIYRGMSGAPLLWNNKVIGVVSGSLNEGGSFAWAIPTKYVGTASMQLVKRRAADVRWPALHLMATGWTNLRRQLLTDDDFSCDLDQLLTATTAVISIVDNSYPPARDKNAKAVDALRTWMRLVPVAENAVALKESPGYIRIRDRMLEDARKASDDGGLLSRLDDDFSDALKDLAGSIRTIDRRLARLQKTDKREQLRSSLSSVRNQMLATENALTNDSCNSVTEKAYIETQGAYYSGSIDEEKTTVGQLRQALDNRCILRVDEYFQTDKKLAQIASNLGGSLQQILEESTLTALEAPVPRIGAPNPETSELRYVADLAKHHRLRELRAQADGSKSSLTMTGAEECELIQGGIIDAGMLHCLFDPNKYGLQQLKSMAQLALPELDWESEGVAIESVNSCHLVVTIGGTKTPSQPGGRKQFNYISVHEK